MNIAQALLARFGNIRAISEATIEKLSQIKGIGFAKAAQIKACFELGKRQDLEPELKDFDIKDPQSVVKAIGVQGLLKEIFKKLKALRLSLFTALLPKKKRMPKAKLICLS